MRTLWQDLRYGARMLWKKPGFTLVAVFTLALGIGANTAIFSVVNAVLLRPLPFKEPKRMMLLWGTNAKDGNQQQAASLADFNDFKKQAHSFSELCAVSVPWSFVLSGGAEPEQIQGQYASANLFSAIGVAPALGRTFLAEEDTAGGALVVILSHGLWQRHFGADPQIVGRPLTLSGNKATIIGVMPAGFQFLEAAELWAPLGQNSVATLGRGVRILSVVGRLKAGSTVAQAQAELKTIAQQLAQQYPDTNASVGARVVPLHEQVTSKISRALWILFGAVGLLLLMTCVNIANLMLVRAAARHREIAIRAALGAGRARLIRQLLTESVVLSVLGGAAGLVLATLGIDLLMALGPSQVPRYNPVGIDATVLGFTLAVAVITGLIFGLAPAVRASKLDLQSALKEGGRSASGDTGQRRVRSWLVVAEMAIAIVLLIGAGLLVRSFERLLEVNPGYTTSNVLTMMVVLPSPSYAQPQQRLAFAQQLEARLKALPEVTSVGIVTRLPLFSALNNISSPLDIEGRPAPSGQHPQVDFRRASTGYFQTMGIPLLKGRLVTEEDVANRTGAVLINEELARRFWPNEDLLGKRIKLIGITTELDYWQTIAGVVGNVRHLGLDIEPRPEVYFHINTLPLFSPIVVIRTLCDPKNVITAAWAQVRAIDRNLPVANVSTMAERVASSLTLQRFALILFGMFAVLALLLASGEARNATTSATSDVVPSRPSGVRATIPFTASSPIRAVAALSIAVSTGPGATAFTVTPLGPSSAAQTRVNASRAALVAE